MRRNSNGISARVLVMAVALTLIIGGIIGGSVAWLTATSAPVTKINLQAKCEVCWLFVKIEKSSNLNNFIDYSIATGWTELENGVYYREIAASNTDQSFDVINGNSVTVKTTVTKTMLNGLTDETKPTLTFTAYAVQKDNMTNVNTAWAEAQK